MTSHVPETRRTPLQTPSPLETRWARLVRTLCVERIEELGAPEAARLLQVAEVGVERLTWHQTWELPRALRVAHALGADLSVLTTPWSQTHEWLDLHAELAETNGAEKATEMVHTLHDAAAGS